MMQRLFFMMIFFLSLSLESCSKEDDNNPSNSENNGGNNNLGTELDYDTFCFYYDWYGSEAIDGQYRHWAHAIAPDPNGGSGQNPGTIPGTQESIASNFYPQLGRYSSSDPNILTKHMDMFVMARTGVLALTWWNEQDETEAKRIGLILDAADKKKIKVCFHLEPYPSRNVQNLRENIVKLITRYGNHPAFYRKDGKPLFFIYDSYLIEPSEWEKLLSPGGSITIRNTAYDALMIGLWTSSPTVQRPFILNAHFDGFYTYFAATGFTYGSTPTNWVSMQKWAKENGKIFIPSVGPGYIDTRIRPWNGSVIRTRTDGQYYDAMYRQAIEAGGSAISITSFNEWHEGSQIEPAVPYTSSEFTYLDYENREPDYYLTRTAYWVGKFRESKQ